MGERTGIAWTDRTWNPWQGCTKVSPGCADCYMFRDKRRYGQNPNIVVRSAPKTFTDPLRWKEPALVFTCSWSDWFHETADPWRDEAWDIVRRSPHLTFQILTKRPERAPDHMPADWGEGWANVWLGTSIENQRHAFRADLLRKVPARTRFISAEPLLGPVALGAAIAGYDQVIVGGESGEHARPMELDWARALRDETKADGLSFYFKQIGGTPRSKGDGADALLDGRTWTEIPARQPHQGAFAL